MEERRKQHKNKLAIEQSFESCPFLSLVNIRAGFLHEG